MSEIRSEDWTSEAGERWLNHLDQLESLIAPVGKALIERARFAPGERIVDVGCGGGANSLQIARRVAPEGHVTGVDIAPMLIAIAKQRLAGAHLANVDFQCLDAQSGTPGGAPFDRLFSRFGVMFFEDTRDAFANMRQWLRPGGDTVFACWAPLEQNPWMALIGAIVARHVDMPPRDPTGPGPFRLADPDATRATLEGAGFTDVSTRLWQGEQSLGGTPAEAASFALSATGIAQPLKRAEPDVLKKVHGEVAEALGRFQRDGSIRLAAAAWFVTARNPDRESS